MFIRCGSDIAIGSFKTFKIDAIFIRFAFAHFNFGAVVTAGNGKKG
jgi:hypothetical protein